MSASAPVVRPWKAPSAATMPVRPVRRASLMAASRASAPELQKKTFDPAGAPASDEQPLGELDLRHRGEEVRDVHQLAGLLRHGRDQGGVVVAERVDGDAADQVEVAPAVDVPDPGAVAVLEHELRAAEEVEQRTLVAVEPAAVVVVAGSLIVGLLVRLVGQHHGADALGGEDLEQQAVRLAAVDDVRLRHPGLTARTHASSLGIIPASTVVQQLLGAPTPTARRAASRGRASSA